MFLGGIFPFLVSSMTMTAVGDAAFDMIKEIRRQFKEIPGLLEGKAKPDTARCVDIATRAALRKMIAPGALAVLSPVIIGFLLGPKALVGLVTEYYTGGSPVEKIAKDGETGSATVLISGLATGMQSVAIPVLTIVSIIFISNIMRCCY